MFSAFSSFDIVQKLASLETYQIHSESCQFLCQVGHFLRGEGGRIGVDLSAIQVGLEQSLQLCNMSTQLLFHSLLVVKIQAETVNLGIANDKHIIHREGPLYRGSSQLQSSIIFETGQLREYQE